MPSSCLFCQIGDGQVRFHPIWSNEHFVAFLDPHPNTPGATIVIPKRHLQEPLWMNGAQDQLEMLEACKMASERLIRAFPEADRCALVFEGNETNHLHARLIPLHGTRRQGWYPPPLEDSLPYAREYKGFITTRHGPRSDDGLLAELAAHIRSK